MEYIRMFSPNYLKAGEPPKPEKSPEPAVSDLRLSQECPNVTSPSLNETSFLYLLVPLISFASSPVFRLMPIKPT